MDNAREMPREEIGPLKNDINLFSLYAGLNAGKSKTLKR
jgi:hypothetical protein